MTATVFTADERLCVRTPFALKDVCKSIPGARWDKDLKCWTYPRTPGAAQWIQEAFMTQALTWDADAEQVRQAAEQVSMSAEAKTATELPEIPLTKTKPWHHQTQAFWFVVKLLGGLPGCR